MISDPVLPGCRLSPGVEGSRVCRGCVEGVSRVCQGEHRGGCRGCVEAASRMCQGLVKFLMSRGVEGCQACDRPCPALSAVKWSRAGRGFTSSLRRAWIEPAFELASSGRRECIKWTSRMRRGGVEGRSRRMLTCPLYRRTAPFEARAAPPFRALPPLSSACGRALPPLCARCPPLCACCPPFASPLLPLCACYPPLRALPRLSPPLRTLRPSARAASP